jgi:hypothetical protein
MITGQTVMRASGDERDGAAIRERDARKGVQAPNETERERNLNTKVYIYSNNQMAGSQDLL